VEIPAIIPIAGIMTMRMILIQEINATVIATLHAIHLLVIREETAAVPIWATAIQVLHLEVEDPEAVVAEVLLRMQANRHLEAAAQVLLQVRVDQRAVLPVQLKKLSPPLQKAGAVVKPGWWRRKRHLL
jgi:hypothetical protein